MREHRFWIDGYQLQDFFSLGRITDDGAVACLVWCRYCVKEVLELVWGLEVTEEEVGDLIRFGDISELWDGTGFSTTLLHPNTPSGQPLATKKVRFVPYDRHPNPVAYARGLLSARLHRARQTVGENPRQTRRTVLGLWYELHSQPLGFPWHILHRATRGLRTPWAQKTLADIRDFLMYLIILDAQKESL